MTTNAPFTSLRLVQLDHLIENATEEAYKDLQNIVSSLPNQSDDAKKRALLQHLNATKQRLHRLQILLQWCHKASAVAECKRVLEVSSTHANAFRDAADQLVYLHGELIHSKAPAYDIPTAVHVLNSGGYSALPTLIESELKVVAPGKGKNAATATDAKKESQQQQTPEQIEKGKAALRRLDFLIRSKLLAEGLPPGMRVEKISNGEAVLSSTSQQYTATVSLVPAPSKEVTLAKWTPPEGTLGGAPASEQLQQQQQEQEEIARPIKEEEREEKLNVEAMDIDPKNNDNTTTGITSTKDDDNTTKVVSEVSQWRWRLISFQLLPTHPTALLPPHLVPWLIRNVEDRMWAASDIQQLIELGKKDLVVVPPPPMTRKQREKKQKVIDEAGRKEGPALMAARSLSLSGDGGGAGVVSGSAQQPSNASGSLRGTGTAAGGTAEVDAGAPGVIPLWAQSPLAALHAVLQHTSAKLAIGSVLMEEARALENGQGVDNSAAAAGISRSGGSAAAAATGAGGWSNGNLRISKLEDRFGVKFSLWPRVPLLTMPELSSILYGQDVPVGGGQIIKKEKLKKEEEEEERYPSIGWTLQLEVPPPSYETQKTGKISTSGGDVLDDGASRKENKKEEKSQSDGTITCVCVPPLRRPESLHDVVTLSVWSNDGSVSTENLLLRASAQHAEIQLSAVQSLLTKNNKKKLYSEAQHAQQLDEVLGVDSWKVDIVDTGNSGSSSSSFKTNTRAGHAMPALQCTLSAHAMLLLHFRPTDGQPMLSVGPFLAESSVELASEADIIVNKAQIALYKKLEAVLTEVLSTGVSRSQLWILTTTQAVVETLKHLVAAQWKENVLREALGYGFGRALLPRCLEGVELETSGGAVGGGGSDGTSSSSSVVATKETTAILRAPYFTSPKLSSPLKESVPVGKQGSLVCYLLADVTSAAAVSSVETFGKQLRLALCWATPRGVPTALRRLIPVPDVVASLAEKNQEESADAKKKNNKKATTTTATKRKREDDTEDANHEDDVSLTRAALETTTGSGILNMNWERVKQWSLNLIAVHQLEAQLEAADCKAEPTEDKQAVWVLLSAVPWLSSLALTSRSTFFSYTDEMIQFSFDPGQISIPEQGAFLATLTGSKFFAWKKGLEQHGLQHLIRINEGGGINEEIDQVGGVNGAEAGGEAPVFTKDKIVVQCMLHDGKYSASQMVAKAACVGATTVAATTLATALKQGQQEGSPRYAVSIQSIDLDKIHLKHTDSTRAAGGDRGISLTVQWSAVGAPSGGGGTAVEAASSAGQPSSQRRFMVSSQSKTSENAGKIGETDSNQRRCCSITSSPQLPAQLLLYLESKMAGVVETDCSSDDIATFLSVLTSVASSAAVVQAIVLDLGAQHAAGMLPGALTVESFSFGPEAAASAGVAIPTAVGVCRVLVHQLGRSLQLQIVMHSSGTVALYARQIPPTREQQPAAAADVGASAGGAGGEGAWLQETWARALLESGVTPASNSLHNEWSHVCAELLPAQLGPVLKNLIQAVSRQK